ncbi:hypothetical protein KY311_03835 [Candidatus Woesearchaeota archaeon]|nr:hypothetical protein [Candidatus Woesearchaeota archaeon]
MGGVKNLLQFYQSIQFLYTVKGRPEYKGLVEKMAKALAQSPNLEGIVSDIGLLLKGDILNPGYQRALMRFNHYFPGFGNDELFDFCKYMCRTFNIRLKPAPVPQPQQYEQSERVKLALDTDYIPF